MARKKANYPLIEGLEITTLAAEGKAMGRWQDVVVFVPMTVPGDVVDVQIRSKRRRYMEGFVVRYVKRSPLREEPFCEHFGVCGGCKWQNLPYGEQLRFKTEQVRDQLTRIGRIALPEIAPCLGSARTQFYRNKLEFTFADRRWLTREEIGAGGEIGAAPAAGFHIPGMFDKVLDIRRCWLQPDPSNPIRLETKRFCMEHGYTFHNARTHTGLMRNMIVRTASTGEVMVVVVFGADDRPRIGALMEHLAASFPQITSLFYVVNTKLNDSVGDLDPVLWCGKDHIVERMEGLQFKVGPKSFYQTNSEQAYELYKVARDFAALGPGDVLYDLYTGTGTIANFCAAHCRKVVGVEYVPEAIADARINSEVNGIANTVFYAGDMKAVLDDDFIAANGRPDVVILDPPRAGVDEPVIEVILRAAPQRIVYVSCNPATQARDLALMDGAYRVRGGAAGRYVPPYAPRGECRQTRAALTAGAKRPDRRVKRPAADAVSFRFRRFICKGIFRKPKRRKVMKRLIVLAAAALMAFPAMAQMQEAYPSYIQVNGRAEKEITPDEFYLQVVINERDSKGRISVESQQRDMIAALRKLGVDVEKQLKVANLSSEFFKKNTSVATAKYQLQLGSAAEVAKVWQALDALGISNVSILKVSHSKLEAYKQEVRLAAMRNARQSACEMAEAIGQSIGKCFYIYDSNNNVMPTYYDNMIVMRSAKAFGAAAGEAASADEPLDFKTIRLEYGVQAKFVLE